MKSEGLQNKKLQILTLSLSIILSLIVGIWLGTTNLFNQESKNSGIKHLDSTEMRRDPTNDFHNADLDKLINPLLDCEGDLNEISPVFSQGLKEEVEKHSKKPGIRDIAVYFRHLKGGMSTGVNTNNQFIPASLLKVPLMIAAYKQLEADPSYATRKFEFSDNVPPAFPNRIPGSKALVRRQSYTIEELIEYMIVYSDNDAATIIKEAISPEILDHAFKDLGVRSVFDENGIYGISAKNYGSFLRILYNATYLNRYHSAKALEVMSRVEYKNSLVAGVNDPSVTIAHKFGERESEQGKQLHDCGIVYTNNDVGDYLVCIMVKGGHDYAPMEEIIRDISRYVYVETQKNILVK
jgi:beta-lactamase class A